LKYPHRLYLVYLLTKKMTVYDVQQACTARELVPPNEDVLREMAEGLGSVPKAWRASLKGAPASFRRWLRQQGVLALWKDTGTVQEAKDFLFRGQVRKDFEGLMLMRGDAEAARTELLVKYPESYVPDLPVLELFCEYFWNLGALTARELFEYLQVAQNRDELVAAAKGDLATTYGKLGLRERVSKENFLDNVIALANQQVVEARKVGGALSGATLMGLAAISRQGIDAMRERDEMDQLSEGNDEDLREKALAFKLGKIEAPARFPTIDELSSDPLQGAEDVPNERGHLRLIEGS